MFNSRWRTRLASLKSLEARADGDAGTPFEVESLTCPRRSSAPMLCVSAGVVAGLADCLLFECPKWQLCAIMTRHLRTTCGRDEHGPGWDRQQPGGPVTSKDRVLMCARHATLQGLRVGALAEMMDTSHAPESFRGLLLRHRGRTGLIQRDLAARVGVSLRSLQDWEASVTLPTAERLRGLIRALLEAGGLTAGRETSEARDLWAAAEREAPRLHTSFEEEWFAGLVAAHTLAAPG